VIVYWTRKKQKDDEKSNLPYSLEASAAATESASPPAPPKQKPGFFQQQWQDWKHRTLGPVIGWEPVAPPIDLPLVPVA
jgi:hypothetical protein